MLYTATFVVSKAEVRRSFITTTVRDELESQVTPQGTNGFQFYAIANLDKIYNI